MNRVKKLAVVAVAGTFLSISGCGVYIPADPQGTTDSVRGSILRVGVALEPGLIEMESGTPTGPLADLTIGFAEHLDATPKWTVRGEESLVTLLEAGTIDLAVGGFTEQTPWSDRAGVSRGYVLDPESERQTVFLVPLGENRFLSQLEIYLDHDPALDEDPGLDERDEEGRGS